MSVIAVSATWQGRSGDSSGVGKSRVTRTFLARTNNKLDDEHTVLRSGLVPVAWLSTLDSNPFFLCRSVRANQRSDSPFYWDVEAEYSDEPTGKEKEQEQNPLARAPEFDWDSAQYQKAIAKDEDDEAVLNSAGDPYDPPPQIDDARWVINVTCNVQTVPTFVLTLNNRINTSEITVDGVTFPEKTLKVQGIKIGKVQVENDIPFRVFSYQLHYRAETWVFATLDAGFQYLDGGDKKEITLADGTKPTTPQLLDGSGGKLASPSPSTAVFRSHNVYRETELSVLPGVS